MVIEIDLTQLSLEELDELSQVINDSIDYSIKTKEMQMNYDTSQKIDHFISEL